MASFKACRYTNRNEVTTTLCPGCGVEHRVSAGISARFCLSSIPAQPDPDVIALETSITSSNYCAVCFEGAGKFLHRIVVPFRYAYPVDRLIKRIKYREDRQLTRVLGSLLADTVELHNSDMLPQVLLPMPMHSSRLRHRGFNQANDIAHWCGKRLGLPVAANQVSRIVDTGSLAGLNRHERQLRILGAFRAADALAGKRVAIVDDVLTTGSSARELAREIYDSGAASVELWVLARTSSTREGASEI